MLHVCVRNVIDIVFSVCIVRRGAFGCVAMGSTVWYIWLDLLHSCLCV